MDAAAFREAFPAFSGSLFPSAQVEFWLAVASIRLSAARWGDLLDQGIGLFVAHNLTLERMVELDSQGTGGSTATQGPAVSDSKTVGPVSKSKSYSPATVADASAGAWNQTVYGQRFYELMRLVGVGGLQV